MLDVTVLRKWIASAAARVRRSDIGASMVEYALLLALIAVICIGAVSFLGNSAQSKFNTVGQCVASPGSNASCPTPTP
jgi:pilus assembly protein Flp/PilA